MQIITPNYILTPDLLLSDVSVAFDKIIRKIAPLEELQKEFPNAEVITLKKILSLCQGL